MTSVGLIVRLEARPGKEEEVAIFLRNAQLLWRTNPRRSRGSPSDELFAEPPRIEPVDVLAEKRLSGEEATPDS